MTSYFRLKQSLFYALLLMLCSNTIQAAAKKTGTPTSPKKTSLKKGATTVRRAQSLVNTANKKNSPVITPADRTSKLKTVVTLKKEKESLTKEYEQSRHKNVQEVTKAYETWEPLQTQAIKDTQVYETSTVKSSTVKSLTNTYGSPNSKVALSSSTRKKK